MHNEDWNHIKAFLLVAETGSLSAAARTLAVSQPTLSRQIQALESACQINLFKRTTQGLQLTAQGQSLVESARQMQHASDIFTRRASGMAIEVEGVVRISANEIVGNYLLPNAICALRKTHPDVQVEIVVSNQASNLNKREADVALRMFRPTQPDLVVRQLPNIALGFFMHRDLLNQHGEPKELEDIFDICFIGYDTDRSIIEGAAKFGLNLTPEQFSIRTDFLLTQFALVRAGAGIGICHVDLAHRYAELIQVLEDIPLPPLEFWCVCHRDVQFNGTIRTVMQFVGEWFSTAPYDKALT